MQSSQGGGPRILRCPNCGATIDAPPFAPSARCGYCQQVVVLAEPGAQRAMPAPLPPAPMPYSPAPYPPSPAAGGGKRARVLLIVAVAAFAALAASFIAYSSHYVPDAPATQPAQAEPVAATQTSAQVQPASVKYELASLLRINATTVDVDGAQAHMLALFPTVAAERSSVGLAFKVPLNDPWFKEAELSWSNEKSGMLKSMALRPAGEGWFRNQKEIADCLAKSLGKPKEQEIDHLSHETSYIFLAHWPKAYVDVYASYLWLSFEYSTGIGTATFANVVKTLDGCASHER